MIKKEPLISSWEVLVLYKKFCTPNLVLHVLHVFLILAKYVFFSLKI